MVINHELVVVRSKQLHVEEPYPVTGSTLGAGRTSPGKNLLTSLVAFYDGVDDGLIDSCCHDDSHCGSDSSLLAHRWKPASESVNQYPPLREEKYIYRKILVWHSKSVDSGSGSWIEVVSPICHKFLTFFHSFK